MLRPLSRRSTAPRFFATPAAFRAWLEKHHASESELVVGFHKRATGIPSITWPESVDEALCFGWIDGKRHTLGPTSYAIRFTPRRPTSVWSNVNVAKVKALTKAGRMRAAGLAAYAKRTPERTGLASFERDEAAVLPDPQARRLAANAKARAFFDAQPPWYRRAAIHWVLAAKQETTRERRFAQLLADSAAGRTIPPLTRPGVRSSAK